MVPFEVGQYIVIPCDVRPGAFPSEFLVTLETLDGVLSGFVGTEYVKRTGDESEALSKASSGRSKTTRLPFNSPAPTLPRPWA